MPPSKRTGRMTLIDAARRLARECDGLAFAPPVTHVYNPLQYAWRAHEIYLRRYASGKKKAVFVGINPGPWGMAQTGVPFGDVVSARDWLGIEAPVTPPANAHAKRPVSGFRCPRREVSGRRLWGLFEEMRGDAKSFFADYAVLNYCPLLFLAAHAGGVVNLTPDKLSADERARLYAVCDRFMRSAAAALAPAVWIGVGAFAEARLNLLFGGGGARIGKILHPSPSSPAANRGFSAAARAQLRGLGVK